MIEKNIGIIADQTIETNSSLARSSTIKVGRLAMELLYEKKNLSRN